MQMSKMIAREQVRKNGGITGIYAGLRFSCSAIIIRCAVVGLIELRCSKSHLNIVFSLKYSQILEFFIVQIFQKKWQVGEEDSSRQSCI
jgi:hypothetical protein